MSDPERRTSRLKLGAPGSLSPEHVLIEAPFPEARVLAWEPERGPEGRTAAPDVSFLVSQEVLLAINRHVGSTLERELGGFLLGNRYRCPNLDRDYVTIDQYSEAKFTESDSVRLSFTLEAWAELTDELSGKFYGKLLVGWYHSHPRMDVFLSSFDLAIHEERFHQPWAAAVVIEPEAKRGGFFCWQEGRINPREPVGFYELLARNATSSVVDWTNYTCDDPRADAPTGPLPPRLAAPPAPTVPATAQAAGPDVASPRTPWWARWRRSSARGKTG